MNGSNGTTKEEKPLQNGHHNNSSNSTFPRSNPSTDKGTRFGGLSGAVEASVSASIDKNLGSWTAPFAVTPDDLSGLAEARTRPALAELLQQAIVVNANTDSNNPDLHNKVTDDDVESVPPERKLQQDVKALVESLSSSSKGETTTSPEADLNADMAANVLTSVVLRSSNESGLDPREVDFRRQVFGTNAIAEKPTDTFLKLCWEAVQDFVLIMLIVLGIISIVVEVTTHPEKAKTNWIEGAAILISVMIVVFVTAGIDYAKQFAFLRLTRSLHDTNTKQVIRDAEMVPVTDDDIVVGDILSVNAHNLASIPADCVLLGPLSDLHMNESSLTGESRLIRKRPGDVILSGTEVSQGSGKMVVIAVGKYSVAGRIKARVYESEEAEKMEGEDENSPLFVKLDAIAKKIGIAGMVAALLAFIVSCIIGLAINREHWEKTIEYLVTAITVLAVAVPEGLPLAVTLALAFSSNKMMKEQNLVKHLDACETMGCATTICTDKTGTLTANKMTARALYTGGKNYLPEDPAVTLGDYVIQQGSNETELISKCIAIDTMNETILNDKGGTGNPTEVALLHLVKDFGNDYQEIRSSTKGRSDQGALGEFLAMGRQFEFSSARKMMSWAVPLDDGGYRLYCKGASEVVLSRCLGAVLGASEIQEFSDESKTEVQEVALGYARRGMRCLALAYRDLPEGFDLDSQSTDVTNSDGSSASMAELDMNFIGLVGIEDPLRSEVPGAIEKCYQAGIDVRLVTGDNPNTAVSIAYQAGILRDFHFLDGTDERVAVNLKDNVLMEGKDFRQAVYRVTKDGSKEFDQSAFDHIWPYLRVLARSSPDDKLTLAHGLNQSNLFADKSLCSRISQEHGIRIFPDRQVVAMTGDGTNDAPALKRADIGFAMGVAGTQIAKDAADIILLDDNFASIVTAAKWGRNVYASIQKFLQFQLTVNIAAVITALVGAFVYQQSPLAAIQLLWVNLLMDSLASLALASEPPIEELLQKPPVNRTDSMITKHMLANMMGQALYQVTVVMVLLFAGPSFIPGLEKEGGHNVTGNSIHYTLIFNAFVWMQLFNEVNCRKLKGECKYRVAVQDVVLSSPQSPGNVFKGIFDNPLFWGILLVTAILQFLIVQFGSVAFSVAEGGLNPLHWGISLLIGFVSLPVQQGLNFVYRLCQRYNIYKNGKRRMKAGQLSTSNIGHSGLHQPAE